jgi:hypothetical protein
MKYVILVFAFILHSMHINAQSAFEKQTQYYLDIPVNVAHSPEPIAVKASNGKWYLSYTLFITNHSFTDLTLISATVSGGPAKSILASYTNKELQEYYRYRTLVPTPPRSVMPGSRFPDSLSSGRTAVLFFWLEKPAEVPVPDRLSHTLIFRKNKRVEILKDSVYDIDSNIVLRHYSIAVNKAKPVLISSPLKGKGWLCANGPAYNTNHQYLTIRDGQMRMAQRFAIDFKKVDKDSNSLPSPFPDTINNAMFYGYGQIVYAVESGTITDIKEGIPENVPQANGDFLPAVPIREETVAGNRITLKMDNGYYAFYAHLKTGSIRVKPGERVNKGQALGVLGNSGNAIGPHLHFHIGDRPSLNGSEGIPFIFDSFRLNGKKHTREIPVNGDIIEL